MATITKDQIIEAVEKMTVMELNELVKTLEEKFDVQAMAPMAMAGAVPAAAAEEAEQTEFDVVLKDPGERKIPVIKLVKDILGTDLKQAKALVDNAPSKIKEKVSKQEAEEVKAKLDEAGALVEID